MPLTGQFHGMSTRLLLLLLVEAVVLMVLVLRDRGPDPVFEEGRDERRQLVRQLHLTDLALWSESRHTRHPSQADLFSPFQNGPAMPDAFPSGSWTLSVSHRLSARGHRPASDQ